MKIVFFFEYVIKTRLRLIIFFYLVGFLFFKVIIGFLDIEMGLLTFVGCFKVFFSNENKLLLFFLLRSSVSRHDRKSIKKQNII